MSIKIMHVTEALGGGVLNYLIPICNSLAKNDFDVTLVYSKRKTETPNDLNKLFDPKVKLINFPMTREVRPLSDLKSFIKLIKLFQKLNPDVIHLHSSKAGALGRVAASMCGMSNRIFYSPHGLSFLRNDISLTKRKIYEFFESIAAKFGGQIIACSRGELNSIIKKCKPTHTHLIENAICCEEVPLKKHHKKPIISIGTVGRITAQKDPLFFLSISNALSKFPVKFVWIGGGEQDSLLKSLLDSNTLDITGWLSRQDALRRMSELDIYIQTSSWEGMPLSLIESQVAGIPAVVTDVVGNRDVVAHYETGFVAKNKDEFINFVRILIEDEKTRFKMGISARTNALQRFGFTKFLQKMIFLYKTIL